MMTGTATMKQGITIAWMLVAGLWTGSALADATPHSTEALRALRVYRMTTQRMLVACSELVAPRHARARLEASPPEFRVCAARALADSAARLEAAASSMAGDSLQALRSYHAAFVRALQGAEPQPGDSETVYDERQGFLFHRLAHAWARFELAETVAQ
jgi:hypothetical protein